VVGAGPSGSAAAAWAARAGRDVLVIDAAEFPRDKACGDGLTPRAVAELRHLGLSDWLDGRISHHGLRLAGFGTEVEVRWPGLSFPVSSSAVPRTELDDRIRQVAEESGASMLLGHKCVDVSWNSAGRVDAVLLADGTRVGCEWLIVADGARSPLGRALGRQWHQQTVYGVAARAYLSSPRAHEPWISSDLELRSVDGDVLPGYGWIFPLGNGQVNIGVGALATAKRPAQVALRPLLKHYADLKRPAWGFDGPLRAHASALLPMGGAVSGVAGANWMLVGDAAGCVNPLNGEGIDYGLETGHLAAQLLEGTIANSRMDYTAQWAPILRARYGTAFSIARRLAGLLTVPKLLPTLGPVGMRSRGLMTVALRVMGNLVTDEDSDTTARLWRAAGKASVKFDDRPPFS